jgi:hypothetical protein
MQPFSRDLSQSSFGTARTSAFANSDLLDGFSEGQVPSGPVIR